LREPQEYTTGAVYRHSNVCCVFCPDVLHDGDDSFPAGERFKGEDWCAVGCGECFDAEVGGAVPGRIHEIIGEKIEDVKKNYERRKLSQRRIRNLVEDGYRVAVKLNLISRQM